MASTLVAVSGKGSNPKTTLYVGGLEESVNDATLHAAFIPFGDIKDVNIPMDHATGKHRGFGFVEFEDKEDAAAAVENMNNAELFGRVLKVGACQPLHGLRCGGGTCLHTVPCTAGHCVWATLHKCLPAPPAHSSSRCMLTLAISSSAAPRSIMHSQ